MAEFWAVQSTGKKISKVRIAGQPNALDNDKFIVSGTAERRENVLTIWSMPQQQADSINPYPPLLYKEVARKLFEVEHHGKVTSLRVAESLVVSSSSDGSVNAYLMEQSADGILLEPKYHAQHHSVFENQSVACTSVSIQPYSSLAQAEIASAGEDGKMVLFRLEHEGKEVADADAMVVNDILWKSSNELMIASSGGYIRLFDRRQLQRPTGILLNSSERSTVNCLTVNMAQVNKIAAGHADGLVTIWDLRNTAAYTSRRIPIHDSHIWEVLFHPDDSNTIITCSEDGSISIVSVDENLISQDGRPSLLELPSFANRRLTSLYNPLSINSFDYTSKILVAGSDSEKLLFANGR